MPPLSEVELLPARAVSKRKMKSRDKGRFLAKLRWTQTIADMEIITRVHEDHLDGQKLGWIYERLFSLDRQPGAEARAGAGVRMLLKRLELLTMEHMHDFNPQQLLKVLDLTLEVDATSPLVVLIVDAYIAHHLPGAPVRDLVYFASLMAPFPAVSRSALRHVVSAMQQQLKELTEEQLHAYIDVLRKHSWALTHDIRAAWVSWLKTGARPSFLLPVLDLLVDIGGTQFEVLESLSRYILNKMAEQSMSGPLRSLRHVNEFKRLLNHMAKMDKVQTKGLLQDAFSDPKTIATFQFLLPSVPDREDLIVITMRDSLKSLGPSIYQLDAVKLAAALQGAGGLDDHILKFWTLLYSGSLDKLLPWIAPGADPPPVELADLIDDLEDFVQGVTLWLDVLAEADYYDEALLDKLFLFYCRIFHSLDFFTLVNAFRHSATLSYLHNAYASMVVGFVRDHPEVLNNTKVLSAMMFALCRLGISDEKVAEHLALAAERLLDSGQAWRMCLMCARSLLWMSRSQASIARDLVLRCLPQIPNNPSDEVNASAYMKQLWQVVHMLADAGHPVVLPAHLQALCHQPWVPQDRVTTTRLQHSVESILRHMKLSPKREQRTKDKLHSIDLVVIDELGRTFAIEVDGPCHYTKNAPYKLLGDTQIRNRFLEKRGYLVVCVCGHEWELLGTRQMKVDYLTRKLQEAVAASQRS